MYVFVQEQFDTPQSQGAAERANRTLIGLIRKVLDGSSDWKCNLRTLLFLYRNRPHSATGVAPMEAMVGWQPSHFIVESVEEYVTARLASGSIS